MGVHRASCGAVLTRRSRMSLPPIRIFLSPPDVGPRERELLLDAFDSNWIAPLGPHVDAFEEEFSVATEVPATLALASGTAALHLALVVIGVEPGDDVLVSDLTFAATANAVAYVGATPVFVDADHATWNMDPDLVADELRLRAKQDRLPRAVVVVDLYGQSADYDRIEPICAEYDVAVIEDAAEALGATYRGRPVGGRGALAAFSFNGNKIITTSGGGMLASANPELVERARHLASQARDPAPHYEHSEVGYNYRLSNLLAAVGRAQLADLDRRVRTRREHFAAYREGLADVAGVEFMPEIDGATSNRWLTTLTIDPAAAGFDREQVRIHLDAHDIEARPVWKPMHLQPVYAECQVFGGSVGEDLFERGICLPSGSTLSATERDRVIELIRSLAA